jgi:phosphatidylinositol alpha-1,6-mannosyltransferase
MPNRPAAHDLLFAYDFPPMGGGIARWMAELALGYPADSLTVSTGRLDGAAITDRLLPQRIDRIRIHADRLRTVPGLLAWGSRAVRLAREPGARFAWCDSVRPAGYVARWAFERTGLPYGIITHGGDLLTLRARIARRPIKRRVMRSILGGAAVYVANSQWTAARCRELLGEFGLEAAASRVRVVPLGTDPARWRFDPAGAAEFRRRRGLPNGRWIVTVARLVEYKGIDDGIRLLASLINDHPDLHYAVIGRGPYQSMLRALSEELDVTDRVHLLTDVGDDELSAAYSIGEIYLGLTRETATDVEGFGISFIEAAACHLPVVATRSGGIPDAVKDGETGLLFDSGDLAGLREGLDRLLREGAVARRMGAAGRALVERYYNWARVVTDMRAIALENGRISF